MKRKGARLGHREFLGEPNIDPREELARNLVSGIPDNACVLAYHASYEIGRLKDLAVSYPRYRKKLQRIVENVRDLEIPFKKKDVYHWKMKGSSSQKCVLPALAPQLSYDEMEISNGGRPCRHISGYANLRTNQRLKPSARRSSTIASWIPWGW